MICLLYYDYFTPDAHDDMPSTLDFFLSDKLDQAPDVQKFFVGWQQHPTQRLFGRALEKSEFAFLALLSKNSEPIGVVTAITDHAMSAYIPLLEVVPEYQGRGVGTALMKRMLEELGDLYMIDVVCDESTVGFYERFGLKRQIAMSLRNRNALEFRG